LILTACGDDKSDPEIEGSTRNDAAATTTDNAEIDANQPTPPPAASFSADSLSGRLIFTQDQTLYTQDLASGDEPVSLASNIDPQAIFVSPDNTTLYYAANIDNHTVHIIAHNLASGEETLVAELTNDTVPVINVFWTVTGWSPDGQWFQLIATRGGLRPMVVSKDGSIPITIGRSVNNWVTWLTDGDGLVIRFFIEGIENRDTPFPEIQLVERLNTDTQERTVLELDLDAITSFADLESALNALDLELAQSLVFTPPNLVPGFDFISWRDPEFRAFHAYSRSTITYTDAFRVDQSTFEGMICTDWEIIQPSVTDANSVDTLYTANDVALISDVTPSLDNSYIFLEWRYAGCSATELPAIQLIHLAADGTTTPLADGINISEDNDVSDGLAHHAQRRLAVSPDGQFVAWIGGTPANSHLHITDITSSATFTLLETHATPDTTE
jgi:hypothetical protein